MDQGGMAQYREESPSEILFAYTPGPDKIGERDSKLGPVVSRN
jgi:hypothetical protein